MKTRLIALSLLAAASIAAQAAHANPERDFDWQHEIGGVAAQPLRDAGPRVVALTPERDFEWSNAIAAAAGRVESGADESLAVATGSPERDFDLRDEIDQMTDAALSARAAQQ